MISAFVRQNNDLLNKLYANSSEAIIFFDVNNVLISLNPAAERLFDEQTLLKMRKGEPHSFCLTCRGYTNEEELMSCLNCYLKNTTKDFTSFQMYLQTKDRGINPFIASFQIIDDDSGVKALILCDLTNQLTTQEVLYRNTMMKRTIKAQEDERKRISRELHDSVAQELLSSLIDLRVMKYLNDQGEVLSKIKQMEASLTRLLDNIRNLSVELRPASLDDLGLEAAFRSHFKWIEENYGIIVHFTAEIHGIRFNSEIETVVYRIGQGAILNAIKYAEVDEITVNLSRNNQHLDLYVNDQGIGFNMNICESKGTGLGIYGMRERAELVGGKMIIASEIGRGTSVYLQVPINP